MPLIEPGRKAPDFTLPDQDGDPFRLSDDLDRAVVLFFYPKDRTAACTLQAQGFSARLGDFHKVGAEVVGVSILGVKSKKKFAAECGLRIRLLADDRVNAEGKPDPAVCALYGVWAEKSMYGRRFMGVVRTTYLVAPGGKVARRWDRVGVPGHVDEVLGAVTALGLGPRSRG